MRQCWANTQAGARCRARALDGSAFCSIHDPDRKRRRAEEEAERQRRYAEWRAEMTAHEERRRRERAEEEERRARFERDFSAQGFEERMRRLDLMVRQCMCVRELAVLGLRPGATPEEIRAAFFTKAKQLHPDRGGTDAEMAALNAA